MANSAHDTHAAEHHPVSVEAGPGAGAAHDAVAMVDAHGGAHDAHGDTDLFGLSSGMFLSFLVVFVVAAMLLKKFAWGPILDSLDQRESAIRDSLENAERIKRELADMDARRMATIAEADAKAAEILDTARRGAKEAAKAIEGKAREEVQIQLENATREINIARDKAGATLRQESADIAITLASKILGENLDDARNRELTNRLIEQL